MQLSLTVCDVCKDHERNTTHYQIHSEGKVIDLDLCNEHAQELEKLLDQATPAAPPTRTRKKASPSARGSRRRGVVSLEEIEKGKQAGTI